MDLRTLAAEKERELKKQQDEQRKIAELFEGMLQTDAWKAYEAYLVQEENNQMNAMLSIKTGEEALKAVTSFATVRRMRQMPSTTIKVVAATLAAQPKT